MLRIISLLNPRELKSLDFEHDLEEHGEGPGAMGVEKGRNQGIFRQPH